MLQMLSRYWWVLALRGAAAVMIGLAALIWPDITLNVLVILFGAYALVDGAFTLGTALTVRRGIPGRGWLVLEGLAGIATGVITYLWPAITTLALLYVIAVWAIITGVLHIVAAMALPAQIPGRWLFGLAGIVSAAFGIYLVVRPGDGAIAIIDLIGACALVLGGTQLACALRIRQAGHTLPTRSNEAAQTTDRLTQPIT